MPHLSSLLLALSLFVQAPGGDPLALAESVLPQARIARRAGEREAVREMVNPAIDALIKAHKAGEDMSAARDTLQNLADLAEWAGSTGRARSAWRTIVQTLQAHLSEDDPELARARTALAAAHMTAGDSDAAAKQLERALPVFESLPADLPSATARTLMGEVLLARGEVQRAAALFERVMAEHPETNEETFAVLERTYRGLGQAYSTLGMAEKARDQFAVIARMFEAREWTGSPDYMTTLHNLALAEWATGHPEVAVEYLQRVIDGYRSGLPPEHATRVRLANDLAGALIEIGRFEDARYLLEQMLALAEPAQLPALDVGRWQHKLSRCLLALGDAAGARARADEAVASLESSTPADHPDRLAAYQGRAEVLTHLREWAAAREAWAAVELPAARVEELRCALELGDDAAAAELGAELRAHGDPTLRLALANVEAVHALRRAQAKRARAVCEEALNLAGGDERLRAVARTLLAWSFVESGERDALAEMLPALADGTLDPAGRPDGWLTGSFLYFSEWLERDVDALALRAFGVKTDPAEIARRLGGDALAVSFHTYREWRIDQPDLDYVLALAIDGDGVVSRIELGELSKIVELVREWRLAAEGAGDSEREAGERLRSALLGRLEEGLEASSRLVVAADGILRLVPFGALPWGTGRLMDRVDVAHEPSLALVAASAASLEGEPSFGVFGAPNWSLRDDLDQFFGENPAHDQSPIPGARAEVAHFSELFSDRFGHEALVWARADATKARLTEGAPKVDFLHIGTHGLAADDAIPTRSWAPLAPATEAPIGLSSLRLGGLQVSGYNWGLDTSARFKGRVLAEELAELELSCEVALLANMTVEARLERLADSLGAMEEGLRAAGARHVIQPMWNVDGDAARGILSDFYRLAWDGEHDVASALREALGRAREAGVPLAVWGAWKLTGS